MNRRQLSFLIILNAIISLAIAMAVVWVVEVRRPDPEALAAVFTPVSAPVAATFTPTAGPSGAAAADGATGAGGAAAPAAGDQAPTSGGGEPVIATSEEAAATPATGTEYVIQVGDSLSGVADRFGIPVALLVEANNLDNPDFVFVGQRLTIPGAEALLPAATATPPPVSTVTGIRLAAVESAGTLATETISIGNDSDLAVNLQGWRLEREGGPSYTFGNILLFPGSGLKLHSGPGTDSSVDVYWNQSAAVWSPGAVARLINPQGTEVARLSVP